MNLYYKEKELRAIQGKIKRNLAQSNFFIRNKWKVIGFGIIFSIWAPTHKVDHLTSRKNALEVSGLSYWELVIAIGIVYSFVVILAHFIWNKQDKNQLKRLRNREAQLIEILEEKK